MTVSVTVSVCVSVETTVLASGGVPSLVSTCVTVVVVPESLAGLSDQPAEHASDCQREREGADEHAGRDAAARRGAGGTGLAAAGPPGGG